MSDLPFAALIEVSVTPADERYDECREFTLVKEYRKDHLHNSDGTPDLRSSLLVEEIGCMGWDYFLSEEIYSLLPAGRWILHWRIDYSKDYWGEVDTEIFIELEPHNRRARRGRERMTSEQYDAIPWVGAKRLRKHVN